MITVVSSDEFAEEDRLEESFDAFARCGLAAFGAAKLASGAIEAVTMATIINREMRRDMANLLRTSCVEFGLDMPVPISMPVLLRETSIACQLSLISF